MQTDMFKEPERHNPKPVPSEQQRKAQWQTMYKKYRGSTDWKRRRKFLIKIKGEKCEKCGDNKSLQIHHLRYKTLGKEQTSDVEVLCFDCHQIADREREEREANKSYVRVEEACFNNAFQTWLEKRYGDLAPKYSDDEIEHEKFIEWLEGKKDNLYEEY